MSWRYHCGTCRSTSHPIPGGRRAAVAFRARHRARCHDGLMPDAEELWPETGPSLPARRMLIGMGVGSAVLLIARWLEG